MTVSCVVRGVECVKKETKERIQAAIAELGYQPDPALCSLSTYRSQAGRLKEKYRSTIAFLDPDPSPYSHRMVAAVQQAAKPLGYKVEYQELLHKPGEQRRLSQRLYMKGIRGLLLGPSQNEERFDEGFEIDLFAIVSLGALHHAPPVNSVSQDYFFGLQLAGDHCYRHGYRRIGLFIARHLEARTGHLWLGAYHALCERYGMKDCRWIYDHPHLPAPAKIAEWIRKEKLQVVLRLGASKADMVPGVQYVSLNDWNLHKGGGWHITVPLETIAREGMLLLDHHLLHQQYGIPEWPKQVLIQGQWVE